METLFGHSVVSVVTVTLLVAAASTTDHLIKRLCLHAPLCTVTTDIDYCSSSNSLWNCRKLDRIHCFTTDLRSPSQFYYSSTTDTRV